MSFGTPMHSLDTGTPDPYISAITRVSKEITFTQMLKFYNLDRIRSYFLPKNIAGQRAANMRRAQAMVGSRIAREDEKNQNIADGITTEGQERKDFLHYILAANATEKGMSVPEIHVNSFSLPIAGSESTASALAGCIFYTLTNPHTYTRLVDEIRGAHTDESEITIASVNNLTYMDAVITETLRLYPPVAITNPRVVPGPHGEVIDGMHVPAGVSVGVNHSACYRDPANFADPDEFHPERWLDPTKRNEEGASNRNEEGASNRNEEGASNRNEEGALKYPEAIPYTHDNRSALQPFSFGPRNCIGRNLARAEMRVALARLLWGFDVVAGEDAEGEEDSEFKMWRARQKLFGFWEKGPLMCRLVPVVREGGKDQEQKIIDEEKSGVDGGM